MSDLVTFVFSNAGVIAAFGIGAVWLWMRPASAAGRRFLVATAALYALSSVYIVPYAISRVLVMGLHEISRADVGSQPAAVVVLGSGAVFVKDWEQRQSAYPDFPAAARVAEGARAFGLIRDGWVISSGGAVTLATDPLTTAATMRQALVQLGVPPARILLEDRSSNTHDEAVFVKPMLRALAIDHVVLVTSDFHMWRSTRTFRTAGISVTAAIARDPMVASRWYQWVRPTPMALQFTASVVHEFLAIGLYVLRGWIRL